MRVSTITIAIAALGASIVERGMRNNRRYAPAFCNARAARMSASWSAR